MGFTTIIDVKRTVIIEINPPDLQSMIDALTSIAAKPAITGAAVIEDLRRTSGNTYELRISKPDP